MPSRFISPAGIGDGAERARNIVGGGARVEVLRFIAAGGPATMSELEEGSELGIHTIRAAVEQLTEAGYLVPDAPTQARQGKRVKYALNRELLFGDLAQLMAYLAG